MKIQGGERRERTHEKYTALPAEIPMLDRSRSLGSRDESLRLASFPSTTRRLAKYEYLEAPGLVREMGDDSRTNRLHN